MTIPHPIDHPNAWLGSHLRKSTEWIFELTAQDNVELRHAMQHAQCSGRDLAQLSEVDFPLPTLGKRLKALRQDVVHGRGFVLVRGFDIGTLSVEEAGLGYWGVGTHLGRSAAQNAQGDLLGHVTDLGVDFNKDLKVRGYQTRLNLEFHNDQCDIVGLLCLRRAKAGGYSRIASSTAIYNRILWERPDLLEALHLPTSIDRRAEEPAGELPYYNGAPYEWAGGRLFCRFNKRIMLTAQRYEGAVQLSDAQLEGLNYIDTLCQDPELHLDMAFQEGDMQFLCNFNVLHSRTAYEDWPEQDRRRYLLRLWLQTGLIKDYPPSWAKRFDDLALWRAKPRPSAYDLSSRIQSLVH